jgi:hypothetical protein
MKILNANEKKEKRKKISSDLNSSSAIIVFFSSKLSRTESCKLRALCNEAIVFVCKELEIQI